MNGEFHYPIIFQIIDVISERWAERKYKRCMQYIKKYETKKSYIERLSFYVDVVAGNYVLLEKDVL